MRLASIGVLLFASLASLPARAITIDGDFADWAGIAPVSVGLLSSHPETRSGDDNSLQTVWMTADQHNLYLSVQCGAMIKGSAWGPTFVALDTDLDRSTGFPCGPLGVDYLAQPARDLNGNLMFFRRIEGANDPEWSRWLPPVVEPGAFAVGRGPQSHRLEMRIPLARIGVRNPQEAGVRFRISDGSPFLDPTHGSCVPAFRHAWFSLGNDPERLDTATNLCPNGDFEQLQEAAARPLPQGWGDISTGKSSRVEISSDACRGKWSLRLAASGADTAGMNSNPIPIAHGLVRFHYKVLNAAPGANLSLFVIGLSHEGAEVARQGFTPPAPHRADGQWHEASFEFDFSSQQATHCLVAPRINEATAQTGQGDWRLDAVQVYAIQSGAQLKLAHLWCDNPCARTGQPIRFSAWVENTGDKDVANCSVELKADNGVHVDPPVVHLPHLPAGSYERVDWNLSSQKPATIPLQATLTYKRAETDASPKTDAATYRLLVVDRSAHYTRQELMTDQNGYWRLLPRPTTLQQQNSAPLTPVVHKRSSEIHRSPYGICSHLPRAKDYETPFQASHLTDGDPQTCWSSQQNSSPYPGSPPWVEIDLGKPATVRQVNLVPYWHNTDFPVGLRILTSSDAKTWSTALVVKRHVFDPSGPLRGDKRAQLFPLPKPVHTRFIRIHFERLPLSGGNYAEVSQGYKARLSEIELIDEHDRNIARNPAGVTVSDSFTGWQNTASTIQESFPKIMDLGVKFIRVSQWGDQTEWATIEREKGKFAIDPVTDAAIRQATDQGVDLLYTLDYGNALYNTPGDGGPVADIGPIFREGHPFCGNYGPRTDAQRQAFLRYVDFVARRYKDRVRFWELWNEENGWYPGFEPELYGKLLAAVAQRLKQIAPKNYVVYGGTAAPAPITTEISLRQGGAPFVDAYAFHPYGIDKPEGGMGTMEMYQGTNLGQSRQQTGWNRLEEIIEGVKKPFAGHGRPDVDVWLDEWGTNVAGLEFAYNPGLGEYACAKYLMRYYIYSGWLNARTAWWALYNLNRSQDWGILDQHDYAFRPMAYALQNVCSLVSDAEPIRKLDCTCTGPVPDPKVIAYTRDGNQETLILAWAAELSTDEVRTWPGKLSIPMARRPAQVLVTDLYWGLSQPATWSYQDGRVTVDRLLVHDYPLMISLSNSPRP